VFDTIKLTDSGKGFGDLDFGLFLQWPTYEINERPIFVHRLQLDISVPSGKFDLNTLYNPGNGFLYLNPYWAMTLYFTPQWALSARLNYVWNAPLKKLQIQAGQAFFTNFDLAYEVIPHLWLAATGYYLKEFTDDTIRGKSYANTREEVLALGCGALGVLPKDFFLQAALDIEFLAKNLPKGISFVLRMIKYF